MKTKFVVDVELSLTADELMSLRQLAQLKGLSVEAVARYCMTSKCNEELDAYAGN